MAWGPILLSLLLAAALGQARFTTDDLSVVWTTPTSEPGADIKGHAVFSGGMPLGNGDLVALAGPLATAGSVRLSVSKADAMDSGTQLLKLGILSLAFSPNPFAGAATTGGDTGFRQTLNLTTATLQVETPTLALTAYVDANSNTLRLDVASTIDISVNVTLSSARGNETVAVTYPFFCDPIYRPADVLVGGGCGEGGKAVTAPQLPTADSLVIYHRNNGSVVPNVLAQQAIPTARAHDWWLNSQFGLAVTSPSQNLARVSAHRLASAAPGKQFSLQVVALTNQTATAEGWLSQLAALTAAEAKADPAARRAAHTAWWAAFWSRSHISIDHATALPPLGVNGPRAAPMSDLPETPALWLEAAALQVASGSKVAAWPDQSPGRGNATQADAARQPVFEADGLGRGVPSVRFDGMGTFLEGRLALDVGHTIVAVMRDSGSTTVCCSGVFFGGNFLGLSTYRPGTGGDFLMVDFADSQSQTDTNILGDVIVAAARFDEAGARAEVLLNGCVADSVPLPKAKPGSGFLVGTRNNELGRYFSGDIAELLVFNSTLNDTALAAVHALLAAKYKGVLTPDVPCTTQGKTMSQQYAITRYLQTIQSRTRWPIKFNGQLFGAQLDPEFADYRDWGPSNWWQNTRLPYGSMLASGDGDILQTLLEYYLNLVPFANDRSQLYFNHSGIYFTETKTVFGPYSPQDYGCKRDPEWPTWLETNGYIKLDYGGDGGTPEIALMALDHFMYTNDLELLQRYLPIATLTADFFRQHYRNRTEDGKYVFWPTQALETYWCDWDTANHRASDNCCVDDMPTVAGVTKLLTKLLTLPASVSTAAQRAEWSAFLAAMPPLPVDGDKLALAGTLSKGKHNSETPELYSVHPYRLFTVGRSALGLCNLTRAINSFNADPLAHSNGGWNQGIMNAALLGLTNEAGTMAAARASTAPAKGYRFSGFMPHEQDYQPSADHLGNYNTALTLMLLQPGEDAKDTIVLFPAWPCGWDVSFKLHGPRQTVVEVVYAQGALVSLEVTPPGRKADLLWANCVNASAT